MVEKAPKDKGVVKRGLGSTPLCVARVMSALALMNPLEEGEEKSNSSKGILEVITSLSSSLLKRAFLKEEEGTWVLDWVTSARRLVKAQAKTNPGRIEGIVDGEDTRMGEGKAKEVVTKGDADTKMVEVVTLEFVSGGKRVVPKENVGVGLLWRRVGTEEDSMWPMKECLDN
ncbi:hypothetical protein GOP47_0012120 [Adiantum capillus-veneris]|uniref:Uncharacterized protein n=1 Tax=Adiantum capillus-veneris TaxID=13818 RepID=A0A9D4UQL4_ADICA|nr:hypothetical protein GOP47_0012120 [Adiantum capillus-veneris]